jgi:hypothetical protein
MKNRETSTVSIARLALPLSDGSSMSYFRGKTAASFTRRQTEEARKPNTRMMCLLFVVKSIPRENTN